MTLIDRTVMTLAMTAALLSPAVVQARTAVAVDSDLFVETASQHGRTISRKPTLARGDRVVWFVSWTRTSGSGSFTVTNALPRGVYFEGSANGDEEVSVDGGQTWGQLADLRVGSRIATPEDVTHVRWHVSAAQASLGRGRIAYSGIVR